MSNTASLKKEYQDRIVPALTKEFGYKSIMQVPVLKKIVINKVWVWLLLTRKSSMLQ